LDNFFQRAWLEIHLDALAHNFARLRALAGQGCAVMAVVKADAYGHGVTQCVHALAAEGCGWFAVSNLEEALQVRAAAPQVNILILGYTPPHYATTLAKHNITQAVLDLDNARALNAAAAAGGVRVRVHIKVDTGMSRLGFFYQDAAHDSPVLDDIATTCALPALAAEGIFTHFAQADDAAHGGAFTQKQAALFTQCVEILRTRGVTFALRHCCNSAGALLYPENHMDLIRPGLALYGIVPTPDFPLADELRPVMEMKTVLSQVKLLPAGAPVSYGSTLVTDRPTLSATVPVGYADGYFRGLSGGRGHMLLNGQAVPILGRVCMDQCVLDISAVPNAAPGDRVTVFGHDGDETLPAVALTQAVGAIPYELLCGINKRVPRVYLRGGQRVGVANYMIGA
jgi:alanine racemase